VSRSVEAAKPLIESRRHHLEIEQPAQPIHVNADPTRLAQILQNLLVNAAKYTPEGGRIRLKVQSASGFVTMCVVDNGRGIAADDLQNIFELFRQAHTDSPTESGLGIGLTLARSLAEMHGGTLEAESPGLGKGSTFVVRLPAVETAVDPSQPAAKPESEGRRVLVVDDNRDPADTTTAILRLL